MFGKEWNQIVAKAWADDEFKQMLLTDPAAVPTAEQLSELTAQNWSLDKL